MSEVKDLDINHGDTSYIFSLNGTDFAVGGAQSSLDPDHCIYIIDSQGLDEFEFNLIRDGLTINLDPNGGTTYVTDLEYGPKAKIICDSVIERVWGGRGDDCITGNEFANIIGGNRGADSLTGCGGSDTFRYTSALQSNRAHFDTIQDYVAGEDFIDLRGIDANRDKPGNNNFHFIGENNFHHKAGELRLTADNVLLGDLNGDGHAELKIVVHGDHVNVLDILL